MTAELPRLSFSFLCKLQVHFNIQKPKPTNIHQTIQNPGQNPCNTVTYTHKLAGLVGTHRTKHQHHGDLED